MNPNIWAIVPAHNEEKIIGQTITDLLNQTTSISILVVADNCEDNTVRIDKKLMTINLNVFFIETVNNKNRKAGAVNQALETLDDDVDAVLFMDADTRIHCKAVEKAWESLEKDPKLAAVCSKAGVISYEGKNPFRWFLHRLQRLEYSHFDSQRVETLNVIKVVHGMSSLHRFSALKEVGFYDENSFIEDYEITVRYRMAAWRVTVDLRMKAWTDVPTTFRDWWKQRTRWNRGSLQTLKKHGWNKATRGDIIQHFLVNILTLTQWFLIVASILMILNGSLLIHAIILIAIILSLADSIYRMSYLENPDAIDFTMRVTIISEMLYGYLRVINLHKTYFAALFKKDLTW